MKKEGKTNSEIATILGRHRSSIGRELKRNANRNGRYNPVRATIQYLHRRRNCGRKFILVANRELRKYVCEKLALGHSPECIAGRYNRDNPGAKLSFPTIYRAVACGMLPGITAKQHLRRRGKRRHGDRSKFNTIKPDHTIHERPDEANRRSRIGDWEGDTVMGGKGCAFVAVDRKTRYLAAALSPTRSSEDVKAAATHAFGGATHRHTLTLDNGSEFAKHRELATELGVVIYFADPRSPWQRGTSENSNDLLRFFFPKGTDFTKVCAEELDSVIHLLNDRPRKCLNWLTPYEVFSAKACASSLV